MTMCCDLVPNFRRTKGFMNIFAAFAFLDDDIWALVGIASFEFSNSGLSRPKLTRSPLIFPLLREEYSRASYTCRYAKHLHRYTSAAQMFVYITVIIP